MEKTTLTVTQLHLGAPLQWEPLVGTAEHDRRVDAYIPGTGTIQAKRATIACDFFQTVEATSMPYPFTRTYHVSIPMMASPAIAFSIDSFSSTISTPSSVAGTKRARDSSSPSAPSAPSKRLPGFSIMTKDGVDITDNQSRGPKTKEQRDHAAKMRKMGACPSCKRRKQKCDPSHQRVGETAPLMTASNSRNSSVPSLTGPISARSSISPQSSIQSAFTPPAAISYAQTAKPMSFESLGGGGISPSAMFDDFTLAGDAGLFDLEAPMLDDEWALGQPPLGQDFDLFSYDNTFDFDANLFVNNGAPSQQRQQQPQLFAAQQQQQQTYENSMPFSWDLDTSFSGNTDAGVEASASRRVDNGSLNTAVNGEYSSSASQNHAMNRGMLQDTTLGIATQQWLQSDQSINLGINANVLDASSFANYQHVNLSDSSGGSSSISSPLSYVESAGTACTSPISEPSVALAGQSGQERALLSPQPKYHHPGGNAAAVIDHGAGAIGSGHKRTSVKSRHKPTITDSHGDFSSRAEWKCRKCAPSSQCTWKGVSIEDVAEYRIINRVQVLVGSKVSYKCLDSKCSAQSFRRIHDLQRHIGSVHYEHLPPLKGKLLILSSNRVLVLTLEGISSTSPLNERQQTLVQDRKFTRMTIVFRDLALTLEGVFSIGTEIIDSDRLPAQMRKSPMLSSPEEPCINGNRYYVLSNGYQAAQHCSRITYVTVLFRTEE